MRKMFVFMMITLDGYMEGENHDISWHTVDTEFNEFAIEQMHAIDTMLFGRKTYELMRDFWPHAKDDPNLSKEDGIVADMMNSLPKIVISRTLDAVPEEDNWKNIQLIKDNVVEEIGKLKQQDGEDIAVFGSNNLCVTLLKEKLLDEVRIIISPIVIGKGTPLFTGVEGKEKFNLMSTRNFKNGNVLLTYKPLYE